MTVLTRKVKRIYGKKEAIIMTTKTFINSHVTKITFGPVTHLLLIALLLGALISSSAGAATDYYVDASRPDDSGDGLTWATAKRTMQAGISLADTDGDVVHVRDGAYEGANNFGGREITVQSENGPANCIIDCEENGNGFGFLSYETSASIVDGFTVRNGKPGNDKGGGIYIVDASPTIRNCIFSGNTADDLGGGIYILSSNPSSYRSTPLISHCIFSGNEAKYGGGGIYIDGSTPVIIRCTFSGNFTRKIGGGIMNDNNSTATLINCAFHGNQALQGGGIYNNDDCSVVISSCTFSNNKAISYGGGIYNDNSFVLANVEITNSIIWGNVANWDGEQIYNKKGALPVINYSDVAGDWAGTGNIDANPKLVFADDPHLQFGSPCIDAGTPSPPGGLPVTDLDGNKRVSDAQVDMGACEFGYNDTPCMAVSPGAYRLIASVGSDPVLKPEIISLRNCGGGVLNWKIAGSDLWLKIYHVQGESSGELNTSAIQANTGGLNAGKHTCLIIITDDEATETSINSPRAVTVTLLVGKELNVPSSCYPDIQTAIDAAEDGDTVLVADSGSPYKGNNNRNLNFKGKSITVKSKNGRDTCTIDCENSGRGFIFQNGEASVAVVDGFTIKNGYDTRGGGIYCKLSSSPTIRNCLFSYNEATEDGGGICIEESFPLIIGCNFEDNSADGNGGGIYNLASAPTICDCTFSRNTAELGGGIYNEFSYQASFSGKAWINDCTFTGNQALASSKGGGGIYNTSSSPQINQCSFLDNTAVQDGGGIYIENYSAPEINFCTFSENSADDGGGIYNADATCAPVIASCAFLDNNVGTGNGGGIYHHDSDLTYYPKIFNSIFFGNQAGKGGGIYLNNCLYKLEISNCTLVSNDTDSGSGIYNNGSSSPTVTNCIFWKNGAGTELHQIYPASPDDVNVKYSFIQNLSAFEGNGNIGVLADVEQNNPHLVDDTSPHGFDGFFGTDDDGLRIEVVSPCIDKGKNLADIYSDLRGSVRPINGDIYPKSPIHNDFDMGAYEYSSYYSGFEDRAVVAFREVKVPSYTLIGEVTEFRWKNRSPFPEDNRINQPGVYYVNLVLVSKDETRRIVLAEAEEVPAQMPPEGYYSWEYIFEVEHAGEWYLQVELTNDQNQFARSQWTFLIGLRQPELFVIGVEEITPPADADVDLSIKPEIEDDFKDSFFWSDYTGRLYPIEPVTAVITWTDQEGDPYPQLVSNIWPKEQIHIADAQAVDLLPADSPYSFVEIRYADNDAQISGGSQFTATTEGYAVLLYGTNSNYDYVPQFEVVKTVLWNDEDHLEKRLNWPIGTEIEDAAHDPNCGSGYVYSPTSPVVSPFDAELYDRDSRTGPIFPVNLDDPAWEGDDLIVFWYKKGISGADWPYKPMRYDPNWPASPEKIIIASQLGSEVYDQALLDDTSYFNFQIYHQPDPELPGCNPNEEHADFFSSNSGSGFLAVYALRNDLNQGDWSEPHYTSEPYVLLKYQDSDGYWYYRIFQVFTEAEATDGYPEYSFVYDGRAGTLVQPPYPLSLLLPLCDAVSYAEPGPWWTDYNGKIWARHGGTIENNGVETGKVRWFYPLQAGFYYDLDGDGEQDAQVTECIPWLNKDPSNSDEPEKPIAVTYHIRWPDDDYWYTHPEGGDTWRYVPELRVGETLLIPKNELPDIMNQCSVAIIFDEPNEVGGTGPSAKLIDPLSERRVPLANLPDDISTRNDAGNKVFVDLPFHLRTRVYYDPINYELVFKGYFDDTVVGDPIVLLNIMSDREWEQLIQLSSNSDYQTAINDLFIETQMQLAGQTELFGCDMALSAGSAAGTGYVTLAFSADPNCYPLPISVEVIKVTCPLYRGEIKVIESDNVFDERLTMRHSGDFGGEPEKRIFEWVYSLSAEKPNLPFERTEDQWHYYFQDPNGEGIGAVDITIGGAGLLALQDMWFSCHYTGYDYIGDPECLVWSEWTEPQLHESWVKRVMRRINPFDQRFSNFHESEIYTLVSMIGQAGERYEGNVALNDDPDNLNNVGLIELYTTLFHRIKEFSIDGTPAVNDPLANRSLLFAASRIADLYMLLGNEAYADTLDPTIGFSTGSMEYGVMAPTIFAFQDQLSSLLEEELALLRGLDGDPYPRPLYNRLAWNFTSGDGEVAYALIYNLMDQDDDGDVDEYDARILYPQGHGDTWGHYLTAIKIYYDLLRHPKYTWEPQCESVLVAGTAVEVDYRDERKFARIAAAKAKTGSEIVNLTYRQRYVEDPEGQWQGYKDADPSRGWGLSEWASRAGQGAYLDWVIGNAILPDEDPNATGIQKIDRTTVLELREVTSCFNEIQAQIDKADGGLNPLGVAKDAIPFDINPTELVNVWNEPTGRTHFEQIYDRAIQALNNTTVTFNHANQLNQLLRRQQDTLGDYTVNIADREADFKSRLIEIFGYPYQDDIGPTGTYATDYDGPDLYHYDYVDTSELMGAITVTDQVITITFEEIIEVDDNGVLVREDKEVKFHLAQNGLGLVKPASWTGNRRAPGEIQLARSDLLQGLARFAQAMKEYDNLIEQIEDQAELLQAQYGLNDYEILVLEEAESKMKTCNNHIYNARKKQLTFRTIGNSILTIAHASAEFLPKMVGLSNDVTSGGRGLLFMAGALAGEAISMRADWYQLDELKQEQAKEEAQALSEIKITTARGEFAALQQLKQLEQLIRAEGPQLLELYTIQENMQQAAGRYLAALARGERLLQDRLRFRQQTANNIQRYRYKDMGFRIFRNDALQKYRAQFDMAARYIYLAAKAYDYETVLLDSDTQAGQQFLTNIVRQRTLGQIEQGVPLPGNGLADVLARLNLNFDVLKGQLGFNNPQIETTYFSLRQECFRILAGIQGNTAWRGELEKYRVDNLWDIPEFRRFCKPFDVSTVAEPALVIPMETNITSRLNFFGWPLGADPYYSPENFATKIRSVGVWFSNYNTSLMSPTPRIYLIPIGLEILRTPSGEPDEIRYWQVVEQRIPEPFPLTEYDLEIPEWIPINDTVPDVFASIRRYVRFRAYPDGGFDPSEMTYDSRLVGRSVWNTQWLLIIPGASLLGDPDEGLEQFINGPEILGGGGERTGNGVTDIKLFFKTYAYSGY
jgi:polymorphic membrane protein